MTDTIDRAKKRAAARRAILAVLEALPETDRDVVVGDVLVELGSAVIEAPRVSVPTPRKEKRRSGRTPSVTSAIRGALRARAGEDVTVKQVRDAAPWASPKGVHDALYKLTRDPSEYIRRVRAGVYAFDGDEPEGDPPAATA